jgi:HEAT repeat protein
VIGLEELDWEVRAFAASCLAEIKDPSAALPLVRAYAGEPYSEAKRQFLLALAVLASKDGRELLESAVAEKEAGLRLAAARGLGALRDVATAPALRRLVADLDLDVRYEALGALAAIDDNEATARLMEEARLLVATRDVARTDSTVVEDNGDRYSHYLLGLALARASETRTKKLLLAIVLAEKPWEHKAFLRMGVAEGLGRRAATGEPPSARLLAGLDHDDAEVRLACTYAVGWMRSAELIPRLSRRLTDSQLDVRHEAVVALGRIATPEAVKALRRAQNDEAGEVRLGAVRALSACHLPEATKALLHSARDEKYMIRTLAVRELGWRSAETDVVPALIRAADDPDYGVREAALAALAHHPEGLEVQKVLVAALSDSDYGVQTNACLALSRLKGSPDLPSNLPVVKKIVNLYLDTPHAKLRRGALEFLDAIRPPVSLDALIAGLSEDLRIRTLANSALQKMSEKSVGFRPQAEKPERDEAILRWKVLLGKIKLPARPPRQRLVLTDPSETVTVQSGTQGPRTVVEAAKDFKWKGLDLALLFDSTGSMAGLIRAAKERMDEVIQELSTLIPSLRVSVYTYRDHGDDYLFYGTPLTYDAWKCVGFLQNAKHGQGGDIPEAVMETVTNAMTSLQWRPEAHKVIVYAGDAPHHPEQERQFLAKIKEFCTPQNQARLHAVFTDTNRRSLDIKSRAQREELSTKFRAPFFEAYARTANAGRGKAVYMDDESGLIKELLVLAFGEVWRGDIENVFDFER